MYVMEQECAQLVFSNGDVLQDWNRKEVDIVTKLDHPNIVKMFGVIENDERVFMILEVRSTFEAVSRW